MNYKLYITKKAEKDILSAVDYIRNVLHNKQAAARLLEKVEKSIGELAFMPQTHKIVDDLILKKQGIRFITIGNYMAFFTINETEKSVHIIRFLYGKRNWLKILKNEYDT